MWPFRPRCLHDWQILDRTMMPSAIEVAKQAGLEPKSSVPYFMFEQKLVLTVRCSKCGAFKQTEHKIA